MTTASAVSAFSHCYVFFYVFAKTGERRMSTAATTVRLRDSLEKTVKEGEGAQHVIMRQNSPVTFTI